MHIRALCWSVSLYLIFAICISVRYSKKEWVRIQTKIRGNDIWINGCGASGYLLKGVSVAELAEAVVPCTVTIEKDGKKADARKMFALMSLGIKSGDTVTVHVGGENEEQVAADLEAFMQENL